MGTNDLIQYLFAADRSDGDPPRISPINAFYVSGERLLLAGMRPLGFSN